MILNHADMIKQVSDNKFWKQIFKISRTNASGLTASNSFSVAASGGFPMITLPTTSNGGWLCTTANIATNGVTSNLLVAEVLDFGQLNLNTNVFTPGAASSFGTKTIFNTSRAHSGPVMMELIGADLNGSGNQVNITYVDQDGNASETGVNAVLSNGSVVGSSGFMPLNTPDNTVRSISNATKAAGTTTQGILQFWGIVNGVILPIASGQMFSEDFLISHFCMPRFPSGANLKIFTVGGNSAGAVLGWLDLIEEKP